MFGHQLTTQWEDDGLREEARERAVGLLREGFALGQDRRDWTMAVRGEDGETLFLGSLNEASGLTPSQLLN